MLSLCTVQANSADGFSNPVFQERMPAELTGAGMDMAKWNMFVAEANQGVQFRWCPLGCICFFCNQHNKSVKPHMLALCEKWNKDGLPAGVTVQYEMLTEKVMVNAMLHRPSSWRLVNASLGEGAGKGATLLNLPQTDFCIWSTRSASHGRLVIA